MAKLVAALGAGGLPKLTDHDYFLPPGLLLAASDSAIQAVQDALAKRTR